MPIQEYFAIRFKGNNILQIPFNKVQPNCSINLLCNVNIINNIIKHMDCIDNRPIFLDVIDFFFKIPKSAFVQDKQIIFNFLLQTLTIASPCKVICKQFFF